MSNSSLCRSVTALRLLLSTLLIAKVFAQHVVWCVEMLTAWCCEVAVAPEARGLDALGSAIASNQSLINEEKPSYLVDAARDVGSKWDMASCSDCLLQT